jgi:hypothetical protein
MEPEALAKSSFLVKTGYALLAMLCVTAVALILLLPAESLITDLVYRAF